MVNLGNSKSEPKITGLTFFHCNKSSSVVLETEMKISEMTPCLTTYLGIYVPVTCIWIMDSFLNDASQFENLFWTRKKCYILKHESNM